MQMSPMMPAALRFAGKPEYMADLQKMREFIPKNPYVTLARKTEKIGALISQADAKELELIKALNPEDKSKAPTGLKRLALKAQLKLAQTKGWLAAARSLGQYLVTVFKTGDDGTEKTVKPEVKEAQKELRAIKTRLDAETDPAKAEWSKEFEKPVVL